MSLSASVPRESILMSEDSPFTDLLDSEAAYSTKAGSAFLGDSRDLLKELPR